MDLIIPVLIGIGILSFLVFVHELGHFLAAKFFGVKVEEFGFGFPFPGKIWSIKKGETEYSINWLPAGGFVRLYGEESNSHIKAPRSFSGKPVGVRIIIAAAGVIVNLSLAVILFTILLATSGFKQDFDLQIPNQFPFGNQTNYVLITAIEENSPAEEAGLKFGDKVLNVDGQEVSSVKDLQNIVSGKKGQELSFEVQNIQENTSREISATPREKPKPDQGALGVGLSQGATVSYDSVPEKVFSGFLHSGNMLQYQWVGMKTIFGKAVEERSIEPVASQSSGPVGIVAVLGVLVQNAGVELLRILVTMTAFISLILGVANFLPIPAMDGGRLLFFYIEAIRGKKVTPKIENAIHSVGFMILIFLFLLITFNDVVKIFTGRIFG